MKCPGISKSEIQHLYQQRIDTDQLFSSYWNQRHRIFSKYDEGVWLTDDAWFGVTAEPVAE